VIEFQVHAIAIFISYLINLKIKHTNGTPKCRIARISIYSLLIGFIRLIVILFSHITSTQQVPRLRIGIVWLQRSCQILNSHCLVGKGCRLLMV
jgi:hypothetical protein